MTFNKEAPTMQTNQEPSPPAAFPFRVRYAPHPTLIRGAARSGCTHAVVHSFGHVERDVKGFAQDATGAERRLHDDLPLFFDRCPAVARERRAVGEHAITRVQERIREKIRLCHDLGLEAWIASYELSLPYELARLCPELYRGKGLFCLAVEENRRFIQDKTAELFETFTELDGYVFTAKEASQGVYYAHHCEYCEDLSTARRLDLLARAVVDGKNSARPDADVVFRIWGTHFPPYFYQQRGMVMWEWFGREPKRRKKTENRGARLYNPHDVLPELARICDPSVIICSKATWQDFDLRQPANPWLGAFPRNREIVEISYECSWWPVGKYFALSSQLDRFFKMAIERRMAGAMALPFPFGVSERWDEDKGEFFMAIGQGAQRVTHPEPESAFMRGMAPFISARLMNEPTADLKDIVSDYAQESFPEVEPEPIADLLISMEELAHRAVSCDGCTPMNPSHYLNNNFLQLEFYKDHVSWACCAYPEGKERVLGFLRELPRVYEEKDKALSEAEARLAELDALRDTMPEHAFEVVRDAYAGFVEVLKLNVLSQKVALTMWAVELGFVEPDSRVVNFVLNCAREREKLLLYSPIREAIVHNSERDRLYGFAGNQRYTTLPPTPARCGEGGSSPPTQ